MNPKQYVYHLVTRNRMHTGQVIQLGGHIRNTLYRFFFEKEVTNRQGEDIFQILERNRGDDRITLTEEDSQTVLKYAGLTSRAIRETIVEMVRLQEFPERPARLSCLYAARSYEEAMIWKQIFESFERQVIQVVCLIYDGKYFEGDGDLLPKTNGESFAAKIDQARAYWAGNTAYSLPEVLIDGRIEVVEILEEFYHKAPMND